MAENACNVYKSDSLPAQEAPQVQLDFPIWVPGAFLGQRPRVFVQQRAHLLGPPQSHDVTSASRTATLPSQSGGGVRGHGLQQRGHMLSFSEPHALLLGVKKFFKRDKGEAGET